MQSHNQFAQWTMWDGDGWPFTKPREDEEKIFIQWSQQKYEKFPKYGLWRSRGIARGGIVC